MRKTILSITLAILATVAMPLLQAKANVISKDDLGYGEFIQVDHAEAFNPSDVGKGSSFPLDENAEIYVRTDGKKNSGFSEIS